MKRLLAVLVAVCGGLASAPAVQAADLALIITNEFYQNHPRMPGTRAIIETERDFRAAGFIVQRVENTRGNFTDASADQLLGLLDGADRLVIVVSGHIARANGQPWLLHIDAGSPNRLTIGRSGLPLATLFSYAADRQGDAVIAIAESDAELVLGTGVSQGYRPNGIPQGVTVITGAPQQVAGFIANQLLRPGQSLAQAAENAPDGLDVHGYVPASRAFIAAPASDFPVVDQSLEQALWLSLRAQNTLAGYNEYLRRYPNGIYAAEAQQRAQLLTPSPQDLARQAEAALNLSRDRRRSIQRNLTLIGFDTAGIDGILGNRSRNAIAEWQRTIGAPDTGYLNANQITRIEAAGARRAKELQLEAERERLAEERNDRQFWNGTGANGTEAGLRRYLRKYPDGLYSEEATAQLQQIERQKRRQARVEEREAWDKAVIQGTKKSYNEYLQAYPEGRFVEEAKARLEILNSPETPQELIDAAKQEEENLNLNGFTRQLIEAQLHKMQFKPGPVDGKFNAQTRKALRKYQRSNSLIVTGFVTRETVVRLLAAAVEN
ncbi:MAG: peptidoglycan-binding protein [Rhodobacter sp.]|nr:peptidoglycan-binding protein [Rhodobacter sp.]